MCSPWGTHCGKCHKINNFPCVHFSGSDTASSPDSLQAGDGSGSSLQPRHLSKHGCFPQVSQALSTKGIKVKPSAGPRTNMYKLAVDTVSLGKGQRFPASGKGWSGMEFSLVPWEQPARGTMFGGAVRRVMPQGERGVKSPPLTPGRAGANPRQLVPNSAAAFCGAPGSLSRVWLYF